MLKGKALFGRTLGIDWNKKYGKAPGGKDPLSAKGVGVHAQ